MDSGRTLLHYRLLEKIGEGAMGVVWKAVDTTLDRQVALKVLPESLSGNPDRLARFEREAKLLASVNHPNIATLYGFHQTEGHHFLTMELVSGKNLEERLAEGPLSQKEALALGEQIADGLAATHRHGVIHRDLKPANIVVTPDGKVKVLDFGLAKALETAPPTTSDSSSSTMSSAGTRAGVILGTAAYMSPEQARGRPLDERTDVWAFGCILYELLTARKIFAGETFSDSLAALLTKEPAWDDLPPGLPAIVKTLLQRCLKKDAGDRLRDIAEARRDLHSALREPPAESSPVRSRPTEKSIAVLPFVNRSAETDSEFFSDGLSEELIHALARLAGLRVASRTSAFRYRGRDIDVRQIGRELNVATVLEGSVRRAGTRLRVTAQLVNADDGYQLWSERYDREMTNVFEIQDEITEAIVKTVAPTLLGQQKRPRKRHTENLEAYELYLKGRHFWHQRTASALRAAIDCFQRAIELDPGYSLAHAGLADAFSILRPYGFVSAKEGKPRAEEAAKRAMELDPTLAESHFASALTQLYYGNDWLRAEPHFRRALELDPSSSMVAIYYGLFLSLAQRFQEALPHIETAIELDPMSPFVHAIGALAQYAARRYEEALRLGEKALAIQPDFALALWTIGFACCKLEQHQRAREAFETLVLISKRAPFFVAMLGFHLGMTGRRDEALRILEELDARREKEYVTPVATFLIHLGLGDREKMYQSLQACVEDQATPISAIGAVPFLDDLASEPRFADIFRRLGIAAMLPSPTRPRKD